MPREIVKGINGMFDVHVGWSDENVQVGVATADGKSLVETLGELTEAQSVWSTLDIDKINQLIRLLRKARDKAYDM